MWNESDTNFDSVDEIADSFVEIYTESMIEAVPKKEIKFQTRRKQPPFLTYLPTLPWWDENMREAKQDFSKAKNVSGGEELLITLKISKIVKHSLRRLHKKQRQHGLKQCVIKSHTLALQRRCGKVLILLLLTKNMTKVVCYH